MSALHRGLTEDDDVRTGETKGGIACNHTFDPELTNKNEESEKLGAGICESTL